MAFDAQNSEIVILVQVNFESSRDSENIEEFRELALSANANPIAVVTCSRKVPDAKFFVGRGKVDEIKQLVQFHQADLLIFNQELTPAQARNLEMALSCRVIDRTELILDIFAQRAQTFEGKLQVELARLQHLSTRLVHGWHHLERQKGGIGLRGGPGEKQLETDRRLIRVRIRNIEKRLEKVRKQRHQIRQRRVKSAIPTVSLVGYTNAGKSTLFNRLTQSNVYVADKLFATLDPTLRQITLPRIGQVMLADTVGFIRQLPHDLVEAFHATLEETRSADLLVHVIDASSPYRHDNIREVESVLEEIGASHVPVLQVFNKIDLEEALEPRLERDQLGLAKRVWISAKEGLGFDLLEEAMSEQLIKRVVHCCFRLSSAGLSLRSQLYDMKAIIEEKQDDNGDYLLEVKLPLWFYERIEINSE